jgi:hypothetical protein
MERWKVSGKKRGHTLLLTTIAKKTTGLSISDLSRWAVEEYTSVQTINT